MILCFYFILFLKSSRPSLPLKKEFFLPLRLSCKESSTFLTKPLFNGLYDPFGSPSRGQKPQEREDVTALRCSEPLRYKVSGASKPSPCCAGWDRLTITCCYLSKAGLLLAPYEAVHNAAIIDAKPKGGFPSISQRLLIQVE